MRLARALIVLCPHRPEKLKIKFGHVGWGYEYPNGEWRVGAIEGDEWDNSINGFWSVKVRSLDHALAYFTNMKKRRAEYNVYKLLTVSQHIKPNPAYADKMATWVAHQPYDVFGRNCMNSAYDILKAFSGGNYNSTVLPSPEQNWVPNDWFNKIVATQFAYLPLAVKSLAEDYIIEELSTSEVESEFETPEWRREGAELFITDRSNIESIPQIEVILPE